MNLILRTFILILITTSAFTENVNPQKSERNLAQFASMIKKVTGRSAFDYNNYGCWCGLGGRNQPVDATDRCCHLHDRCYDVAESYDCDTKLFHVYKYTASMGSAQCHDDADSCNYRVCMCDKKATECFFNNLDTYDSKNKENVIKDKCKLGFESSSNCESSKLSLEMSLRLAASNTTTSVKLGTSKEMSVNIARTDEARSITCMAGTVANYERTSCLSCRPGTYTSSSGWYCTSPSSCGCNQCPDGYVCPGEGTINPQICQAGELVNYSKTKCDKCAIGTYSKIGERWWCTTSDCNNRCRSCPDGYVCPCPGTVEPIDCSVNGGALANGARTQCLKCSPGTYAKIGERWWCSTTDCNNRCRSCPDGYVCPGEGTVEPIKCAVGMKPESSSIICLPITTPVGF